MRTLDALVRGESPGNAGRPDGASGPEGAEGPDVVGSAVEIPRGRANPELLGIRRFQAWLDDSGRMSDEGGSPWWREVNGLLLLDMERSVSDPCGSSGAEAAWVAYWSSGSRRVSACWTAHQRSILAAADRASATFELEPESEQEFIAVALASVRLAASGRLPTRRVGAATISVFCRGFYPSTYPSDGGASGIGQAVLRRLLAPRTRRERPRR